VELSLGNTVSLSTSRCCIIPRLSRGEEGKVIRKGGASSSPSTSTSDVLTLPRTMSAPLVAQRPLRSEDNTSCHHERSLTTLLCHFMHLSPTNHSDPRGKILATAKLSPLLLLAAKVQYRSILTDASFDEQVRAIVMPCQAKDGYVVRAVPFKQVS
jgi:hypothetical protein